MQDPVALPSDPPPPPPPVVLVTAGSYKGATSTGNFVFFDVTPGRAVRGFRVNDFRLTCDGDLIVYGPAGLRLAARRRPELPGRGERIEHVLRWTPVKYTIRVTGTVQGSSASGTAYLADEFTLDGRLYRCATEQQTWTATRLP